MPYTHSLPPVPSFEGKGLLGYTFGPLKQKDLEIYYIEVEKGHDTFMVSKRIARTYYVLSGSGYFTIGGQRHDVVPGMLVEVPPKVEFSYSGRMKLVGFCKPRWFDGNDRHTKWNPDVVQGDLPPPPNSEPWKMFGKRAINSYLRLNGRVWKRLPPSVAHLSPVRSYFDALHALARRHGARAQAPSTYFLRNRPMLELIRRLVGRRGGTEPLRVAVLGCSTGVEAYSIAWTIRSARPDLKLVMRAADISKKAVEFGQRGRYSLIDPQLTDSNVFERVTEAEMTDLFDRDGDVVTVKPWIREGIEWRVGDVTNPETIDALGPQDIVIASNFLCHMPPKMAEECLRNIARLARPDGYLFVSGIDFDVRTKVADDLGWRPVQELLEEIHEGDPVMKTYWPWHYAGVEPLNKKRTDWQLRYAAALQAPPGDENTDRPVDREASRNVAASKEVAD